MVSFPARVIRYGQAARRAYFYNEKGCRRPALMLAIGLVAAALTVPSPGPAYASEPVQANSGVTLTASDVTATSATLTLAGHTGDWWLKRTTPADPDCEKLTAGEKSLTNLSPGTAYTYKAYSDSTCSTELATETFTTPASLTAGDIHGTGATLTISGHSAAWYYQQYPAHPLDVCRRNKVPAGTSTVTLTGLDADTSYTFKAYSNSSCSTELTTDASDADFTTSRVKLSPARLFVPEEGTADYTVTLHTAPTASVTVTLSASGDGDITFDTDLNTTDNESTLTFTTVNYGTPQSVRVAAANDVDKTSDTARIVHTATSTDSNYNNITSTLVATERDNDVCQGTTAVGKANSGGLVDDCNALMAAKPVLSGSSTALANWKTDTDIGSWTGITTAGNRVTRVVLRAPANKLSGAIPAGLGTLTKLTHLDLYGNNLTGPIPSSLGNLTNLENLNLYWNNLTGSIPGSLGNLTNLENLNLGWNKLSGSIPSDLGSLGYLTKLTLSYNQLSGAIPSTFGNLTHLTRLELARNDLSSIPSTLGNLTNLTHLNLQGNQLSSIPSSLGNLTNLTTLNLIRNSLTGSIPDSLGDLTNLTTLELHSNKLTGAIPSSLGNLTNLTHLDLSINDLTGAIPSSLGNLTNLTHLYLSSNELSGDIPGALNNLVKVTNVNLTYNNLTGCYPTIFDGVDEAYLNPQNNNVTLPWCAGLAFYWNTVAIPEGSTGTWYGFTLGAEPTANVTVTVSISGDSDLSLLGSTSFTFRTDAAQGTTGHWAYPHFVWVQSQHDSDADDGVATVTHTATSTDSNYNNVTATITAVETDDDVGLFASEVKPTSAVLRISNHPGTWYYKHTAPTAGQCSAGVSGTTATLADLTQGASYTFKAYSDSGCSTQITTDHTDAEFTTPYFPVAPASVTATRVDKTLTVSWNQANHATGYNVRASYDDQATWQTVATNLGATTYVMNDVPLSDIVYIRVQSVNQYGKTTWTTAGPFNPVPPSAPASVSGSWDQQAATLTISWSSVEVAGSYNVNVSYGNPTSWQRVATNEVSTSYVVENATLNKVVYVAAQSVNAIGESEWTQAGPINPHPPLAPGSVTATYDRQAGALNVSWTPEATAAAYDVVVNDEERGWRYVGTSVSGTSFRTTDVAKQGWIYVGVRSVNAGGKSDTTYADSPVNPVLPPAAPESVTGSWDQATGVLTINWSSVATATGYNVSINKGDGTDWRDIASNMSETTVKVNDIWTGNRLVMAVQAENSGGVSAWTKARLNDPPPQPASITASWDEDTKQVEISWSAVATATSYNVVMTRADRNGWIQVGNGVTVTSLTVDNVHHGGDAWVGVQSVSPGGISLYKYARTNEPPPPLAAPDSVTAAWENGALVVTWAAVDQATGYNVNTSTNPQQSWTRASSNTQGTTLTIDNLDTSAVFHVAVQAINSSEASGWTNAGPINPAPPPSVPAAPDSVTAAWENGALVVTWAAVDQATGYHVNTSTNGRNSWTRAASNVAGTTLTITGLGTSNLVYAAVASVNSVGVSGWTNADPVDPYQPPPSQPVPEPSKPSSVTGSWQADTLVVTWAAAANASSYNVKVNDIRTNWTQVGTNVTGTSLEVTGLDNSGDVYLAVQSVNSVGAMSHWTLSGRHRATGPLGATG